MNGSKVSLTGESERQRERERFLVGFNSFPFPALNLRAKCHVHVTRYHVVFHEPVSILLFELHFPVLTKLKRKTKKEKERKKKKSAGNILFTCMVTVGNGPMATSFL
jgi:hypothetical protein